MLVALFKAPATPLLHWFGLPLFVRVPAVVRALAPVGDLEGPDSAQLTHFGQDGAHREITIERLERLRLPLNELPEIVAPPMGGGQGQELDFAARLPMLVDRVLDFQPPPFRDLGSTDGAAPDAAAGLQAAVMGRAVLFALPDPHPLRPLDSGPQAQRRAGFREDVPRHRLEGEALDPQGHSPRSS